MRRSALPVAALLGLGVAAYSGSLGGPFVYDDRPSIVENPGIQDLGAFVAGGLAGTRSSRFVGYLSFALNYRVGGLDVRGYHLVNLAIHLASALLVVALVRLTFRTPALARSALAGSAPAVAFAAAALFAAHPLQTEAVTYVVQRLTSLATFFYLAAVVAYARWRIAPTPADPGERGLSPPRPPLHGVERGALRRDSWYALAFLATVAAMNTKEIAFTLPLCIVAYERSFFGPIGRRRWLALAPVLATLALIPIARLQVVSGAAGGGLAGALDSATRVQSAVSRWDYARTQLSVLVTYLRLLVLPVGQNFQHAYPTYGSFLEPRVVGSAAVLVALAAAAVFLFRRGERDGAARLAAFGIGWFFLTSAVESSVVPIFHVMAEHRVYLPSVGVLVAAAVGLAWLVRRFHPARCAEGTVLLAAVVASVLAVATFQRNEVWASEVSLWSDTVAKSPRDALARENLGVALSDAGRPADAARELATAIQLDPARPEPYYNLGRVLLAAGTRTEEAAALLARAVAARRDWPEAHANLAAALNKLRRYPETIDLLEGAPAEVRQASEARFNLAVAYAALGELPRARAELEALRIQSPGLAARLDAFLRR